MNSKSVRMAAGTLCLTASFTSTAQDESVCKSVLEHGTFEAKSESNIKEYSAFYNAFCQKVAKNETEFKDQQIGVGVNLFNSLKIHIDSNEIKNNTYAYMSSMCQQIQSAKFKDEQTKDSVRFATQITQQMFDACIKRAGMWSWPITVEGGKSIRVAFRYQLSEAQNPRRAEVFRFKKTHLGTTIEIAKRSEKIAACTGEPKVNQIIAPNSTVVVSCDLNPSWSGESIDVGALIATEGLPLPQNVHIRLPVPLPQAPAAKSPILVLQKFDGSVPLERLVGEWVSLDMAQITQQTGENDEHHFHSPTFALRIRDVDGILSNDDKILGGMFIQRWLSGVSDPAPSTPPALVPIVVSKELSDIPTANFASFKWYVNRKGLVPKGWAQQQGYIQLDARQAKRFGIQAQFVGSCLGSVQSSFPTGGLINLAVPRAPANMPRDRVLTCPLRLRLCSTPSLATHTEATSCESNSFIQASTFMRQAVETIGVGKLAPDDTDGIRVKRAISPTVVNPDFFR